MLSGRERARRRGADMEKYDAFDKPHNPYAEPKEMEPTEAEYALLKRKSLPELLALVKESGWLVNNLFQYNDRKWRANLRFVLEERESVKTYFHEWAEGETEEVAMAAAIWNMRQRRNEATRAPGAKNADSNQPWAGATTMKEELNPEILREMTMLALEIKHLRAAIRKLMA